VIARHRPVVVNHGFAAEHSMPCAVCWTASAVLNITDEIFEPCWGCQKKGWTLKRKFRWIK